MKKAVFTALLWGWTPVLLAQTGTEFWMAPPDVTYAHNAPGDEPIYLNVTTGNAAATVTISQPAQPGVFNGGTPIVLNMAANTAQRYNLTALKAQLETRPTNSVRNTGLRIVSTSNITVYYESSNTNNPDIMALKGQNGLGLEFYIPLHKYTPFNNHDFSGAYPNDKAFASFDIVATQNNTQVMIYSPVAVDGYAALTPFTITLNQGQTYSCANTATANHHIATSHPSGAVVIADKPIAISLKDDSDHNPSGGCYDLMLDQIVPVNNLGQEYVAVKGQLNNNGDESVFVMAVENNTNVYVNGSGTPTTTLFAGQSYRIDMDYLSGSTNPNSIYVSTSKPAYATHVTGFGCEMGMASLPPLNCAGSQQVSFTRSTSEAFYLNLLVRSGHQNNFVVTPATATIPGSAFVPVPGTGGQWLSAQIQYNTTQVPVTQAFIVTNTTDVFSLGLINGGATSGCRYGFFSEFAGDIVANAGPDQTRCAGSAVTLSGSISGGSTTGIWTSSGSGTFSPDATALNAAYTPSLGDQALGTVTLTLTSTGPCTPESDQMVITIQPLPIPNAGVDLSVCSNNPVLTLAGSVQNAVGGLWSGGAGTFNPSLSTLNATYTPTAAEVASGNLTLTLTTNGNGVCAAQTDNMAVTFTPSPTVNAGPDQTRCANNATATLSGSFTVATGIVWSGGAGGFSPSTTNANVTYTPTAAEIAGGSVTLTLTTTGVGNCNAVSDQITINYTTAPTVDAGPDVSVCVNNPDVTLSGSVTVATGVQWSGGLGTFNPNGTTLNATYTPTAAELAAGTLTLTLTTTGNGTCTAVSDSRLITFTPAPVVNAGADGAVCASTPTISLNGSVVGATGGIWSGGAGTFGPNNTTLNASYVPTGAEIVAGTVTLTLTSAGNGNCNAVTDQVTFTITPTPTVNAGADQTLCGNNATATLNAVITVASGVQWSGGTGAYAPGNTAQNITYTPSAIEVANGSVTLTATTTGNGTCLAAADAVTLTFTAAPTANAGADQSICANNATVTLNGSVSVATGGQWTGGLGTFTPGSTALNAAYTPTAGEIAGGTLTLTLSTTGNGTCVPATDAMAIIFTPAPTVNAGADGTVCASAPNMSLAGSIAGATGGIWSGGAGTFSPNNTTLNATYAPTAAEIAAGTVTLTLTSAGNGNCNAVSDQVTWTITPAPTVNGGADQTLCGNNAAAILNATFTVASGVQWSGGSGSYSPSNTAQNITYSPSPLEVANGSVTLTVTTTGNGTCLPVSDLVTIIYTPSPTANAGSDAPICANNAAITLSGSVTVATGGQWSGGLGSFNPGSTALNAIYTPTAGEIAAGTLTLTLTTTGNGACSSSNDAATFTFTPAPTVNAGADGAVCANNASITLNGSITGATGGIWTGGLGSFSPSNTALNAVYTPSVGEIAAGTVTLTLTSAGNGNCNAVTDQVTHTITPAPTVNLGADRTLCANNATVSLNAALTVATGVQWTGGSGTYAPSNTAVSIAYTPSSAEIAFGSVTLTATTTGNGTCLASSDQVLLTFTNAPTANAGIDQSVCVNNAAVTLNGSVTIATGGQWSGGLGSFSPSNTALNAVYTPTAAELAGGTLTLTLTTTGNGTCSATSDAMTITFTPAPTVNAGADGTVCANNASITLNGAIAGATGGIWSGGAGTFTPNSTTLNAAYAPTAAEIAAGTITLTLTSAGNGNCNAVTDQVTYTITPPPTVNTGADQTLCGNNATAILNAAITVASGVQWSGGSGTYTPGSTALNITYSPSPIEIANGSVTLTATTTGNGTCLAAADQVTLTFTTAPAANAGADQSICVNNASITLNGSVTIASGGIWSGGTGTYAPGNTALNTVYTPTAAEIAGGTLTLTLTTTGNGTCSPTTDQVTITFTPAPTVNAGADGTVCANTSAIALNGSIAGATGGIWSGGTGTFTPNNTTLNATYTPSAADIAAGTVTLTLTSAGNGTCNAVTDQAAWTITPAPTVSLGADRVLCANNATVSLNASIAVATGVQWTGGTGTYAPSNTAVSITYTPSAAEIAFGSVTLTATTTGNGTCLASSDQILLTFTNAPTASAGADQSVCVNNATISLSGSVTVATGGQWSGGLGTFSPSSTALNASYTPTAAELAGGSLTLTLTTTGNGTCSSVADQVTITFTPAPIVNAGADGTFCSSTPSASLNGSVTGATGGIWSGGAGTFTPNNTTLNATYTPTAVEVTAGTVTLTLTSAGNGTCNSVSDQVTFTITPSPTVNAGADQTHCGNNANAVLNAAITVATGVQWSGGTGVYSPGSTAQNITYSPSATEVANGSATLTVTTTGNGTCVAATDQVTIVYTLPPTANAGADVSVSSNNSDVSLAGIVTLAAGGQWSGGLGTFNPGSSALNTVYSPTAAEIAGGSMTLTLTTTGNGTCSAVSDQITITFTGAPTANAGADQSVCANSATTTLNGSVTVATGGIWSGGAGTFTPNNTTLNATYMPSAAEIAAGTVTLTLTTVGNGNSNPVTDQLTITITPSPVSNAGPNITVCANQSNAQLVGSVTGATGGVWSGGSGSFNPTNTNLNAIYSPTLAEIAAGTVTLTLTTTGNGLCNAVQDQVLITIVAAPVVNAGPDLTTCVNNPNAQLAGSVVGAGGGIWSGGTGVFSPSVTALNAVYTPSSSELTNGSVTLTLTSTANGTCVAVTDQVMLVFSQSPVVNAGADATVCQNAPTVTLNGAVTVASGGAWTGGGGIFTPNANTLNATYSPTPAEIALGTATLTLTSTGNGNCSPVSDAMTITILPAPVVDAGAALFVCSNNASVQLGGSVSGAGGGQWSGGAGTFSPSIAALNAVYTPTSAEIAGGSMTLTLTTIGNGFCQPVTDQVTITFTPAPTAEAGTGTVLCANNANISLAGSVTVANGGTWSGVQGTFTPNANNLNAVYHPSNGEIASGTVTLTLTTTGNNGCNAVSDQVTYTFSTAPTANAGPNTASCANNPGVTLNGAVTIATGGIWSGGGGSYSPSSSTLNAVYTPSAAEINAGMATLTLTTIGNGTCNPVSDQMVITIGPSPIVDAGANLQSCANNPNAQLTGTVQNAIGGIWSGAGTFFPGITNLNAIYTPTAAEIAAGTATVTLTSTGNGLCNAVNDQVTITIIPSPIPNAGPDQTRCSNNPSIQLAGGVTNATGGTWSGGLGSYAPNANNLSAIYTPTPAEVAGGSLTLTLTTTGNNGCNAVQDQVTITFSPSPTANAGADALSCANNPGVALNGAVTVATGGIWSGGAGIFAPNNSTLNATYTPTAAEITAGTVALTLTTVGNGNCVAVSDQMTITVAPSPIVNAGANQQSCANNANVTLNGSVQNATGGTWTGAGTFSPNANTLNATYTPTAAEISAGTATLTLTSTGNGLCNAVSDQVTITINPAPIANAGPDQSRCANNAAISLAGGVTNATGGTWTGGLGSYSPNANNLNATYTPTAAEIAAGFVTLTLTTTGNGLCVAVTDQVTIAFTPSPTVNAGTDGASCANNPAVGLNGAVTIATGGLWSGGAGSFSPNSGVLNAVYTPAAVEINLGTVTLTLTTVGNGNCTAVTDQMTITIAPSPIVDAGTNQQSCANNANVTLNGSVQNATGGTWTGAGAFSPNANTLNATYTPTAAEITAGTATLTLTSTGNGLCNAVSDQMTITINPAPLANAGPDQSRCSNNASFQLAGNVSNAGGGIWSGGAGTYSPNSVSMTATYTPTAAEVAAGFVTLTLTSTGNGLCTAVTDQVTVSFTPSPSANAGTDLTSCANNPAVTLNGAVTVATGGIWSGGGGSFSPNSGVLNAVYTPSASEITAGTATLTLTTVGNGNCSSVDDQVIITINPAPIVNAGPNVASCANNPNVQLTGSVQSAGGGVWTGAGTFSPNNTNLSAIYTPTAAEIAAGTATLTLTSTGNGLCNAVSDQVMVTIGPAPVANAGSDQTVCANNASIPLAGSVTNASGGTWSGAQGTFDPSANVLNATYTPSAGEVSAGFVTLTLTSTGNGLCTAVSDQVTYTFSTSPTANAGVDAASCANNAAVTLAGAVTVSTGGIWSGGAGSFSPSNTALNAVYTPNAAEITAGTVTLTLTTTGNGNCTAVSDAMTISIDPSPIVDAGTPLQSCANAPTVQLAGSVQNAAGGTWSGAGTFSPSNTALNATYTPTAGEIVMGSATVTLTSTGNGLCNAVNDQVTITIAPAPVVNAGADGARCANNASIQLSGAIANASGGVWSGAQGSFNPSANTLNAVYTPSQGEIIAGFVTLTLTSTGNGLCAAVSDQVTYTFTPAPTANAGGDAASCANNAAVTLNGAVTVATGGIWTGGTGGFNPNNGTLNAIYTPSAAEIAAGTATLTLTTVGNGTCNAVNDQVTISISPAPIVDAGTPLQSCANDPDVQLTGTVQHASGGQWTGAGTFSPSSTNLNAVYTPTAAEIAAGTATVTLTSTGNGLCNAVTDQVTISIAPAPVVNAGNDQVLCSNNASIQLAGQVTNASGGGWSGAQGSFSPSANALNAVYTPSQGEIVAGFVTLTLTSTGNGLCNAVTDQVTVSFTPAPTAGAGADAASCANNAAVALNGAVTIAIGGIWSGGTGSFSPSNGTLNATYTPSAAEIAAGTATLTLTTVGNGNCTPVSDQMSISIAPAPVVDAGPALQSCANNAIVQLAGSIASAGGGIWSGNGTFSDNTVLNSTYTPTAAEISAGTATVTLTSTGNGLCNAVSDQVTITITPAPAVNGGADQTLCANNASVQLVGSISVATGGVWSGGLGTFAPNSTNMNAVYMPTSPELTAGFVDLTLTSTGNGGCVAVSDIVHIVFTPAPTANAGADALVCANSAAVTLNGAVTVATGGIWSGGNGIFTPNNTALNATYTPTINEINGGSVNLTLTTTGIGNCIAVTDQMHITISPVPVVNAGPDQQICKNNPGFQLSGFVGNATGGVWTGGAGMYFPGNTALSVQYTPTAAEIANGSVTFTLTSTGMSVCAPVADQVTILFTDPPVVNAGVDQFVCTNNANTQLQGIITNANGGVWTGGNGTFSPSNAVYSPIYTPTEAEVAGGSLTLTLTSTGNGNCFSVQDDMVITFTPAPTIDAGADLSVCANNPTLQLNGAVTVASGAAWSGGSGVYSPNDTTLNTTYTLTPFEIQSSSFVLTLTSTGNGNCLAVQDQLTITVIPEPVVDAGVDIVTCANDLNVALNGSVQGMTTTGTWTTTGTGTFSPNASAVNATYLASSVDSLNGSVDLTLTSTNNGLCNAVSDVMTITILPNGVANAGADVSICASEPSIQLNGTIMGNATEGTWTTTGAGTFSPAATSPNANYILDASDVGVITFTWSVNSCDNAMDQMVATIVPVSLVSAGADHTVCVDDLDVLINGSVSGASNSGVWSTTGTGVFTNPNTTLSNIYQASAQDSIAQGVDLILTATNTSVCIADVDTMHIEIFPYGTVNAGTDLSFCSNNADVQLNGTMTGDADQFQWTTTGTGSFFPNSASLTPTYIPSAVDTAIGSLTLTLSAMNSCNQATDAMTLTLTPAPYVNAGPDQTYCNQGAQFTLSGMISGVTNVGHWTTTGTGTIANAGSLNTTYTASAADLASGSITFTLSSLNNGNCLPVADEITIWITDGITADAGPDQQVCVMSDHAQMMGNIINGAPSGVWTSSGSGTFQPSNDLLNTQYYFSANDVSNGVVVLTLTSTNNGTCVAANDQMILTFGSSSFAYAGTDREVCANDPIVQLNGNFSGGAMGCQWNTSGTGFFSNTTDPQATYTLSSSDIALGGAQLTLTTITDGTCTPASDAMAVTVPGSPGINAGPDQIICTADPVQLFANATNASGGTWMTSGTGTFLDPNALVTLYTPSAADSLNGTVVLTVTTTGTGACNAVSDQVTIDFGGGLSASAGSDVIVCSTDPNIALNGAVNGTTTGVWTSSGTGSFSPSATALNATYIPGPADFVISNINLILSTTNNQGCPAGKDTVAVTYNVPAVVNAGQSVVLCDGIEDVQLNALVQHHTSMQWFSTGTGLFAPSNDVPDAVYTPSAGDSIVGGVYLILTAHGMSPCGSTTDSLYIDIGPTRIANAGADQFLCATGQGFQLDGSTIGVPSGTWTTNGTGSFVPDANALNATYIPSGIDLVFPQLQFFLATTNNQGCPADVDTMMVSLEAPATVSAGQDVYSCDPTQSVSLDGSFTGATGIQWGTNGTGNFIPNAGAADPIYQPSGTDSLMQQIEMIITSTGSQFCPAATDTMLLIFENPLTPAFSVGTACAGVATQFTDQSTISNGAIIAWNWDLGNGATASGTSASTSYSPAGPYNVSLTVVAQNGCTATVTQTVNVMGAPTAGFGVSGELFAGELVSFSDSSQGAVSWQYDFGDDLGGSLDQDPTYIFPNSGQFIVVQTVSNDAGCTDQDSILVVIGTNEILPPRLPNAFTPNGDGMNDVFYVRGGPFVEIDLKIYNGWGELIFATTDPQFGWDGTYNGEPEVNGVYTYTVKATTVDGLEHDRPGKVSLIR